MGYYIDQAGGYHEGDTLSRDTEVPRRPSAAHEWNGFEWILSLAVLVEQKHASILAVCEGQIAAIKSGYPDSEVLSWSKQETEARAWTADNAAPTPLLTAMATARGIDKAELVTRVIAKADLFAQISGTLIGKRQALEDQLAALPADATAEDVEAIQW